MGNCISKKSADKKVWENLEKKKKGERTRKVESRTQKKFLAVGEACVATFWPTPGFKGRTFVSLGFSTEGTLISASTVPHCTNRKGVYIRVNTSHQITILAWLKGSWNLSPSQRVISELISSWIFMSCLTHRIASGHDTFKILLDQFKTVPKSQIRLIHCHNAKN